MSGTYQKAHVLRDLRVQGAAFAWNLGGFRGLKGGFRGALEGFRGLFGGFWAL